MFKVSACGVIRVGISSFVALLSVLGAVSAAEAADHCARNLTANVVAIDQPLMYNRLGAQNVNGMIYALARDVITDPVTGRAELRPDKRPRPLVLRMRVNDCLTVNFTNRLTASANPNNANPPALQIDNQVADRTAGFHPLGLELAESIADDSSNVGRNLTSLAAAGATMTYKFFAAKEGAHLVVSHGATFGAEGTGGNTSAGLFGAVIVEPLEARLYRSQVTEEELRLATRKQADGITPMTTPQGQPVIDYEAVYPNVEPWIAEGKAGLPIINMLTPGGEIVHSDIVAVIAGPNTDGTFAPETYPIEKATGGGKRNPSLPTRLEAFREFVTIFHDETMAAQAFPEWYENPKTNPLAHTLHGVRDSFMINYGSGGIGSEIIANRLGVGPMHDCLTCAYEEFFLTSYTVGDPAMLVDTPANFGLEACDPALNNCAATGPKATKAFYPADPSNVHHSYVSDFVKFRNLHAGPKEQHIFHLHNHQWLFNPNDDNSNYIDAQGIGPGSAYTYEINFGGSGNRNRSAGDAIYHCHFYPHFAQGMWALWRNHDTFEAGTRLRVSGADFHAVPYALKDGTPAGNFVAAAPNTPEADRFVDGVPQRSTSRALPDGEIAAGTPIPAVVPLPGKALAPMPGRVTVVAQDLDDLNGPESSQASVDRTDVYETAPGDDPHPLEGKIKNPGYPFWIASIETTVGQRPTTPPLDMNEADGGFHGGLPRHTLDGYLAGGTSINTQNRLDFSKVLTSAKMHSFLEAGTDVEQAVMAFHAVRNHASTRVKTDGSMEDASFVTNGQQPVAGAPYFEPCADDTGKLFLTGQEGSFFGPTGMDFKGTPKFGADSPRIYKAANIQLDVVLNKVGYHYPQQRIITLWEDVQPTLDKVRPPEPFVMRLNTFDCARYLHTNLVPEVYELDDYQVRTPTDIIGQHIHLPKWDLVSADGSANGWNYEDGTLSPGAVRERIEAINHWNDLNAPGTPHLVPLAHPFFGPGPNGKWLGARTTIQRWFADPVVNLENEDRGLGIIFTHDHFGPSTHQQIGLYATVLVEPADSTWVHNETGVKLGTRDDGGPTTWQAAILPPAGSGHEEYREFFLQFSDFQHAYLDGAWVGVDQRGDVAPPDENSFRSAINPAYRQKAQQIYPDMYVYPPVCPDGSPRPCPEAISADDPGLLVVNYRNEPVGHRIYDPRATGPDGKGGSQAAGLAGDLAYALQSRTDRAIGALNRQPNGPNFPKNPLNQGLAPGDPYTAMLRVHPDDTVRIKAQVGGHEEEHNLHVQGVKWLQAGSGFGQALNSGWRNSQAQGISEQFTFRAPIVIPVGAKDGKNPKNANQVLPQTDYAYTTHTGMDGWWSGVWGIMRAYNEPQNDLFRLPSNPDPKPPLITNNADFEGVCPLSAPKRPYALVAMTANELMGNALGATLVPADLSATMHVGGAVNPGGGTLVYNPRSTAIPAFAADGVVTEAKEGPLHDPTALMYVPIGDLVKVNPNDRACRDSNGVPGVVNPACRVTLGAGAPVEPPVLRAAAGECVEVTLYNRLPQLAPDLANLNTLMGVVQRDNAGVEGVTSFNNNLIRPSSHVGLQAQLVAQDVSQHGGLNVGFNQVQTVEPVGADGKLGKAITYRWYAGDLKPEKDGNGIRLVATPVEFGGTNLMPSDKVKQGQKGLMAALIVEPEGASWVETDTQRDRQSGDPEETRQTRASATVTHPKGSFRDLAIVIQKGQSHRYRDGSTVENIGGEDGGFSEDSQDMGQMAINGGSEPLWFRYGLPPHAPFGSDGFGGVSNANMAYSNGLTAGEDPVTPVFTATAGQEARMRVLIPNGIGRGSTFTVHGHSWQRDPYVCPGDDDLGMVGRCKPFSSGAVGSRAIGDNPMGLQLSFQESINGATHFEMRLPKAGGEAGVQGDFLFRDQASFGNMSGVWGLMRVGPPPQQ